MEHPVLVILSRYAWMSVHIATRLRQNILALQTTRSPPSQRGQNVFQKLPGRAKVRIPFPYRLFGRSFQFLLLGRKRWRRRRGRWRCSCQFWLFSWGLLKVFLVLFLVLFQFSEISGQTFGYQVAGGFLTRPQLLCQDQPGTMWHTITVIPPPPPLLFVLIN